MNTPNYYDQIRASDLTPLSAYQIYGSVKLYFNNKKYDYVKYGINRKTFNEKSFDARPDKHYFTKLANQLLYSDRYMPLIISNIYNNNKVWAGELITVDAAKRAVEFRKYNNTFHDSFVDEIRNLCYNGDIKSIKDLYSQNNRTNYFSLLIKKKIHPTTAAIFNHLYYAKYISNTGLSFVYEDKAFYLGRYYNFIPKDIAACVDEQVVFDIMSQI